MRLAPVHVGPPCQPSRVKDVGRFDLIILSKDEKQATMELYSPLYIRVRCQR